MKIKKILPKAEVTVLWKLKFVCDESQLHTCISCFIKIQKKKMFAGDTDYKRSFTSVIE